MSKKTNILTRGNTFIAKHLSIIMSSMWLFWILTIVIVIAGILEPPNGPYEFVMFVISAGFQAIALPVLAFVSNIQGDRAEKVARETLTATKAELDILKQQNEDIKQLIVSAKTELKLLREQDRDLEVIHDKISKK